MRYSINSRFYGALLGATLGEKNTQPSQIKSTSIAKVLIPGAQSLVELGKFEREDWQEKLSSLKLTTVQTVIATLPLTLFYHDNQIKLRQNLLSVASIWQDEPLIQVSTLALGYAIAQALTEKLLPHKLIPQTVAFIGAPASDLTANLMQVQSLIEQKAGTEKAVTQLTSNKNRLTTSIALAFYYFLSTPEHLNLSINRSWRGESATTALVGALSGAYNSVSSIPSSWQTIIASPQTNAGAEMLHLSECLVAVWSGVYNFAAHPAKLSSTAVAAPRVLRPR